MAGELCTDSSMFSRFVEASRSISTGGKIGTLPDKRFGVSICTLVPVKQVKLIFTLQSQHWHCAAPFCRVSDCEHKGILGFFLEEALQRQYLYLCTSKASKVITSTSFVIWISMSDEISLMRAEQEMLSFPYIPASSSVICVSICTFISVKQVK
jgi:hypothetical protein